MNLIKTPHEGMQEVLEAHTALAPLPIEALTPEHARQMPLIDRAALVVYGRHFFKKTLSPMPPPVGRIEHRLIPGSAGNLLARFYFPADDPPDEGWPVLVYFHGGGWVIANLDTYDTSCRALCEAAQCIVASVHYRQAPEHPWPAAVEDAVGSYRWIASHAPEFGGNPFQVAIGGESAGGNLAAVVSQTARDQNMPLPLYQLLIYPATDLAEGFNSSSAQLYAQAKPLNVGMMQWFYNYYIPAGTDRRNPYISPLYANQFSGLPPATVILAEIDPLRSDGEAYAEKMLKAGVPVNFQVYEGVTHEFFGLAGLVKEATAAVALAAKDLRSAFDRALTSNPVSQPL